MASNGLMKGEAKVLGDCLERLTPIVGYPLLGGTQQDSARSLERRLKNRMNPEDVDRLKAEADAFIAQVTPTIESFKKSTEQRHADEAAEAERVKKAQAERLARIAAEAQEQDNRRRGIFAAVSEVIG